MNDSLNKLIALYNSLYKETDEIYGKLAHFFGMSDTTFWLLYFLRENNPSTQSELASYLSVPKQTVNTALKRLEEDGIISLETDPRNHRSKLLRLTVSGEDYVKKTIDRVFDMELRAFSRFDERERDLFLCLAKKHVQLLGREAEKILKNCAAGDWEK